jgi:hypothetical protein
MKRGFGGVIAVVAAVAFVIFRNVPSWDSVGKDTVSLNADQAWTLELEMFRSAKVKIKATEASGKNIVAYWLNESDHKAVQSGTFDESIVSKYSAQAFFSGSANGEGEATVPKGDVYIYFESVDPEMVKIDYEVFIYQ